MAELNFWQNFEGREDLKKFKNNSLLLYALQLKYNIEDIEEVAATSLVDGNDDKKVDLVFIDIELEEAVIAQSYFSSKERKEAPSNKASDLNTGVSWLLTRDITELPERLRSVAKELREGIHSNSIKKISLWYVHNLPESENVKQELKTVENTSKSILNENFYENDISDVVSLEIGINTLEDWYQSLTIPIQITEEIKFNNIDGYILKGNDWESITVPIPGKILYNLYSKYGTKLFSANIRDYLGSRKADSNINNGIKETAKKSPENFYIFNNGITAIVNSFEFNSSKKELLIKGISIVNGAQTTGSIGSLKEEPNSNLQILAKFIKPSNPDILPLIVKFNNSQNKITAPDFRSNDPIQKRLIEEFKILPGINYSARRGGAVDIIQRNPNILPAVTAGQVLAAFHANPDVAYNRKSKIWESDKLYSTFFNEHTTAKHIFFIYSLLKAIEDKKHYLAIKEESEEGLTDNEQTQLSFLRTRGGIIFYITSISNVIEDILNKKIANKFSLEFCELIDINTAKDIWYPILDVLGAFSGTLKDGLNDGIKNKQKLDSALNTFKQFVNAIKISNKAQFEVFSSNVCS